MSSSSGLSRSRPPFVDNHTSITEALIALYLKPQTFSRTLNYKSPRTYCAYSLYYTVHFPSVYLFCTLNLYLPGGHQGARTPVVQAMERGRGRVPPASLPPRSVQPPPRSRPTKTGRKRSARGCSGRSRTPALTYPATEDNVRITSSRRTRIEKKKGE